MSAQREELIKHSNALADPRSSLGIPVVAKHVIRQLVAALAATEPRTITTVDELDALAEGALLEASGTYLGTGTFADCHVRKVPSYVHGSNDSVFEVLCYGSIEVARQVTLPATVLYEPTPGGAE